jgi:hypothetical protein
MNYLIKAFFFCSVFLGMLSCKDDICNNIDQGTDRTLLKNEFEILSFNSKDELLQAIQNGMNSDSSKVLTRSKNFKSLLSSCETKTKSSGDEMDESYYEKLGYDTLVPNKAFAKLINPNGEIIVKDSIYKITPNGTYYFSIDKKQLFYQLYSADSTLLGTYISDDIYRISDGIYRRNTFKLDNKYEVLDESYSSNDTTETVNTRSGVSEPSIDSFPIFDADHHTFFGKLIQNIFGSTKEYCLGFETNRKRRVKGSFYFYNYGVYAEVGVQGWTDKKNWIGWSKTASDELRVGWRYVILETKIPDYLSESLNKMNTAPSISPNLYMNIPGTMQKVNTAVMIIPDFSPTLLDRVVTFGSKELYNYLEKRFEGESEWKKAEALLITTRTHIYTYIMNEDVRKYDTKSYTHVFANQAKFMVTVDPYNLPGFSSINDAIEWAKMIKGTTEMAYPTLKYGEVYSCARFGDEWKGMKIVKK